MIDAYINLSTANSSSIEHPNKILLKESLLIITPVRLRVLRQGRFTELDSIAKKDQSL